MRGYGWALGVSLLLALVAWKWWNGRVVEVEVGRAFWGPLKVEILAVGEVEGLRLDLSPQMAGRVAEVSVREGEEVEAGQILARLEDEEAMAALRAAEGALRAAEQRAEEMRAAWEAARKAALAQEAQAQALVEGAEARQREVEAGPLPETVEQARASLRQAEAALEAAWARWEQAKTALEQARLTSEAQRAQAEAALRAAEAKLARLRAGARVEEIRQAEAALRSAEANLQQAQRNYERMERLFQEGAIPRLNLEQAETQWKAAQSQWETAREQLRLLQAGPHPEELRAAEAEVEMARSQQQQVEALRRQVEAYEKEVAAAEAQWKAAQAQREAAAQNLRWVQRGARPEQKEAIAAETQRSRALMEQARTARLQAETHRHEYQAALALVEQARAQWEAARAQWRHTLILAPVKGIIARRYVDPGEFVAPGQVAFTLVAPGQTWVVAKVDDEDAGKIRLHEAVEITARAYPDRVFQGEILEIGALAEPKERLSERARIVRVKVRVEDPQGLLKPGMEVDVRGEPLLKANTLLVPNDALVEEEGGTFLWVVNEGQALRRRVETGFSNYEFTEIRSGLQEGEEVVVRGKERLREGMKVRARPWRSR